MKKKVQQFIEENHLFTKDEAVLVACSGGEDSMCLLEILHRLGYHIEAIYVNHNLRKRARKEERFVQKYCEERNIPCHIASVDVRGRVKKTGESTEEAARYLRYEEFRKIPADKIAVAHHKNDQAETVLFHILRGTSLRGASGMHCMEGNIVRPLLCVTKDEIHHYTEKKEIPYCIDETNGDERITRNFIRRKILPLLVKVRKDAVQKLCDFSLDAGETDRYLTEEAEKWIRENVPAENLTDDTSDHLERILLPVAPLLSCPEVLQLYIIRLAMEKVHFRMKDKGRKNLQDALELLSSSVGKQLSWKKDEIVIRNYETLEFKKVNLSAESEETPEKVPSLHFTTYPHEKNTEILRKEYTKQFDYDKIKEEPVLRHRLPGDLFSTVPGHHKKLKDYFIDEKIPKETRDSRFLLASGDDILWIIGDRISEDYKVTDETKTILEVSII